MDDLLSTFARNCWQAFAAEQGVLLAETIPLSQGHQFFEPLRQTLQFVRFYYAAGGSCVCILTGRLPQTNAAHKRSPASSRQIRHPHESRSQPF